MHSSYLDRFPPQDLKVLRALSKESRELVYQYAFDFICLLDLDADAHAVHTRFDEHSFVLIS